MRTGLVVMVGLLVADDTRAMPRGFRPIVTPELRQPIPLDQARDSVLARDPVRPDEEARHGSGELLAHRSDARDTGASLAAGPDAWPVSPARIQGDLDPADTAGQLRMRSAGR